jgi:hypothetical protein
MVISIESDSDLPIEFGLSGNVMEAVAQLSMQLSNRLLDVTEAQLSFESPNILASSIRLTISGNDRVQTDVPIGEIETQIIELFKVNGFEFTYLGETFKVVADCTQYIEPDQAENCGQAVGCVWMQKEKVCAVDAAQSSTQLRQPLATWAAPEIEVTTTVKPENDASRADVSTRSGGSTIMYLVVIFGFMLAVGIAYAVVKKSQNKSSTAPLNGVYSDMMLENVNEDGNANGAFEEPIDMVTTDPVTDSSTGAVTYSYGALPNELDLDGMDEETAFNDYGAVTLSGINVTPWKFGSITREAAEGMLRNAPPGGFIVRDKVDSKGAGHVITMRMPAGGSKKPFRNYRVVIVNGNNSAPPVYVVDDIQIGEFNSLEAFIAHLQTDAVQPLLLPLQVVQLDLSPELQPAVSHTPAWNVGDFDELDF